MESQESISGPVNLERLNERQQIRRLHHQLAVIYSRVFLTGDWEGQHVDGKEGEPTTFDEQQIIDDESALVEELGDFVRQVESSIPRAVHPEDLGESAERHDFNRRLFVEALEYVQAIIAVSKKDIGSLPRLEMLKAVDENIHYFRDLPPTWQSAQAQHWREGGPVVVESQRDDQNATEGLKKITDRLAFVLETEGLKKPLV